MRKLSQWNYIVDGDRWRTKGKRDYYLFLVDYHAAAHDVWVKIWHVHRTKQEIVVVGWSNQVAPKFKAMVQAGDLKPVKRKASERHGAGMELWW